MKIRFGCANGSLASMRTKVYNLLLTRWGSVMIEYAQFCGCINLHSFNVLVLFV